MANYSCINNHITKIKRPQTGYPDTIECLECSELAYRVFGQFNTQIAEGKMGNSDTGYNQNHGYMPAPSTPMSHLYGNAGRYNTQFEDGD